MFQWNKIFQPVSGIQPEMIARFRNLTRWPLRVMAAIALLALIAPFLANDLPYYAVYKGHHLFPALSFSNSAVITDPQTGKTERLQYDIVDWKILPVSSIIFPPVPYSPNNSDLHNADYIAPGGYQQFETAEGKIIPSPVRFRHWLGTGKTGNDVLSGLIHGTRVSFTVGIIAMLIAGMIGIFLGAMAGYYGDYTLTITNGRMLALLCGFIPAWFYGFTIRRYTLSDSLELSVISGFCQFLLSVMIFVTILFLFYHLGGMLERFRWFSQKKRLPVDSIVSRVIEIFISLPRLLLVITLAAITRPSFLNLILLLGFTSWTEIARLMRAEFLRLRELDYITAARSLGYSNRRIIFIHALPNGIGPVLVALAFGAASAILAESSLSFLGIGVPQDVVTWGSLLASGTENTSAWWLIVFPGFAIFITIFIYNLLGEGLRKTLMPEGGKK
jgi:peptide/nickel transport system permease protein